MPTEIGNIIKQAVQTEIRNAVIASPRFSDYRVHDFIETGAFEGIDQTINDMLRDTSKAQNSQTSSQLNDIQRELAEQKKQILETVKNLRGVSDPESFLTDKLLTQLKTIPLASAVLAFSPIIIAAMSSPMVIDTIVSILTAPGGPFDKKLKIIIDNNIEQFFSREDQKRRQLGLDQVVYTQFEGYGNAKGRLTTNTLNQKKATGITELGLNESILGVK